VENLHHSHKQRNEIKQTFLIKALIADETDKNLTFPDRGITIFFVKTPKVAVKLFYAPFWGN
jgi:hypothetical protein